MNNSKKNNGTCTPNYNNFYKPSQPPAAGTTSAGGWKNICPPIKENMCAYGCSHMYARSYEDRPTQSSEPSPGNPRMSLQKQTQNNLTSGCRVTYMGSEQQFCKSEKAGMQTTCTPVEEHQVCPPGNMNTYGQHMPGNMNTYGQHMPGNMNTYGQHMPGNMNTYGQHMPGNMQADRQSVPTNHQHSIEMCKQQQNVENNIAWNGQCQGTQAPTIGCNGNWIIMGMDTGVSAIGRPGPVGPMGPIGPTGPTGPIGCTLVTNEALETICVEKQEEYAGTGCLVNYKGTFVTFDVGPYSGSMDGIAGNIIPLKGSSINNDVMYCLCKDGAVSVCECGSYLVTVSIQVEVGSDASFCVQVNGGGVFVPYYNAGSISNGGRGTLTTVLDLKKGDKISIALVGKGTTKLLGGANGVATPTAALTCVKLK